MVGNTAVEHAAARIAESFHAYARHRGWDPKDYRIFMKANEDWGHFSVEFASRAYNGINSKRDDDEIRDEFKKVWTFVRDHLRDEPGLISSIGLVLVGLGESASLAHARLRPGEVRIDDALLNPEVEGFRTKSRKRPRNAE